MNIGYAQARRYSRSVRDGSGRRRQVRVEPHGRAAVRSTERSEPTNSPTAAAISGGGHAQIIIKNGYSMTMSWREAVSPSRLRRMMYCPAGSLGVETS